MVVMVIPVIVMPVIVVMVVVMMSHNNNSTVVMVLSHSHRKDNLVGVSRPCAYHQCQCRNPKTKHKTLLLS